jgi:hypothetical protein
VDRDEWERGTWFDAPVSGYSNLFEGKKQSTGLSTLTVNAADVVSVRMSRKKVSWVLANNYAATARKKKGVTVSILYKRWVAYRKKEKKKILSLVYFIQSSDSRPHQLSLSLSLKILMYVYTVLRDSLPLAGSAYYYSIHTIGWARRENKTHCNPSYINMTAKKKMKFNTLKLNDHVYCYRSCSLQFSFHLNLKWNEYDNTLRF